METDSVNTWHQDSIVISKHNVVMGTPQRWSSRKAAHTAKDVMISLLRPEGGRWKSWVVGTPKRQAVSSPQAGEFDSTDAMYLIGSKSESEVYHMCVASDDEGTAPAPSNRISRGDRDED